MNLTHPGTAGDSRQYSILGRVVALSTAYAGACWLERLDRLLAGFRATDPSGGQAVAFSVRPGQDVAVWQIEHGNTVTLAHSDNALLREMERAACAAATYHADLPLLLHAGAVVRDGMALLLPAASGAGKSTLTLALARQGWLPLTDDICPLARDGDEWIALPCPRCCHLSVEAVAVVLTQGIALEGPVADLAGYYRPPAWGAPAVVRAIAMPRFAPATAMRRTRLSQAECLVELISASYEQARWSRREQRLAARHLATRVPAFRLTYGSVDDALSLVEGLMDELARSVAPPATRQPVAILGYSA